MLGHEERRARRARERRSVESVTRERVREVCVCVCVCVCVRKGERKRERMSAPYIGNKFGEPDHEKLADFEKRVDPNNAEQMSLLEEMRAHTKKVKKTSVCVERESVYVCLTRQISYKITYREREKGRSM